MGILVHGLRHLRRAPDLTALQAAPSPGELARLALIPAGRNLGIAVGLLPADIRSEATAALLACRVLDAYEDLCDRATASSAVAAATDYLTGVSDTPPPPLRAIAGRDSEAVDLLLAARIHDIRALLAALPVERQPRTARMLGDVGAAMAANLDSPMPRTAYGERVLGRVVRYACAVVTEDACTGPDVVELAGCIGIVAQSANDLRDGELALYGCRDRAELIRMVLPRLLAPTLGGFALITQLGPRTPYLAARMATAYMMITTAGFLCALVGAPTPVPRRLRLGAAVLAAASPALWTRMVKRVRRSADGAIRRLLDSAPAFFAETGDAQGAASLGELIVDSTFVLVRNLPAHALTGELPERETRRMMLADHVAFGALDRLSDSDIDAIRAVATRFQRTAIESADTGRHP